MARKRRCKICGFWFKPHPRAGDRQRACSSPECQRERHRRSCLAWHVRNPGYDRDTRLRQRVHKELPDNPQNIGLESPPIQALDWIVIRDAVGLEVVVVLEEALKVVTNWARDAVRSQLVVKKRDTGRLVGSGSRDDIACIHGPP